LTEAPSGSPVFPFLDEVRVDGAIFLRAVYTEPWAYESFDGPTTADVLRPGTDRVTLFHVNAGGRLWVALADGEEHWADTGDVIVLPYGDQHAMGGQEPAERVSIATFLSPPPWTEFPVLVHGAGGARTDVVCGYLHSSDPLFDPSLRALPPLFVVRPDEAAAEWVRASIDFAMRGASPDAPVSPRLPELLLSEALRIHLATAPAADHGFLAALRDPVLAPALAALHTDPAEKWTVSDLAARAFVSRSLLDSRFREVLGRSPIRYLADWRMHLADDLLRSTGLSVFEIARRVGYDAEEAFSRAFKRARGETPSARRRRGSAPASSAAPSTSAPSSRTTGFGGFDARAVYDAASTDYEDASQDFWQYLSVRTVERLRLQPGERVLDVPCGTGPSLVAAAERVGPTGAVEGVDFAERMLAIARDKVDALGLGNVDLRTGDMTKLERPDPPYDAVICVLGIFFVQDMPGLVRSFRELVHPDRGRVAITVFGERFYDPLRDAFVAAVSEVEPGLQPIQPWCRTETEAELRALFDGAGFDEVTIETEDDVLPLPSPDDWWRIVMGSGLRRTVTSMERAKADEVHRRCNAYIREHAVTEVVTRTRYAVASSPRQRPGR
jgi:AraC-like DNA-binding protein/ubiquinone/menaquinone biosynthesis C-methylase UbiE